MNKIYKVIWSEARKCYVVVAEIAKNHGKNNVRSIVERLAVKSAQALLEIFSSAKQTTAGSELTVAAQRTAYPRTAAQWIVPLMTVGVLLQTMPGFASTIKDADNKSLTSGGNVHNIYTQQILSNDRVNFGYNRFQEFKITQGDIANMYFHVQNHPEIKSENMVNLVKSKIDIQGTVNAIKDNRIGGNLYFISPNGMTVGPTGVINTGRFVGMVPDSDNFSGKVGTSGMWGSTTQMAYQFEHYISNFGKRNKEGEFSVLRNEWAEQEELKGFKLASGGKIEIAGQVNTRSGILLGAAHIDIKNGALLQGNKNIDFTSLVNAKDTNGNVVTHAMLSDVGMTAVADDKSGDIILRAATEHDNTFLYSPTVETIINTTLDAKVDVDGTIKTDGKADISASATQKFDSSKFTLTKPIMETGRDLLRDLLGLNIDAAGARKLTTAQVNLKENGKIAAAGDVSLQADASTTIKLEAKVRPSKADGTTSAMPVAAATVGIVKNKALVDVKGDITSTAGDVALKANANTNVGQKTLALTPYTAYGADGDKGNAIYVGVSWLTGDNLAQIDIDERNNAITAKAGDFSAEAHATSDLSAGSFVEGADKTFASTSVTVLDFDTATNVNIRRSIEAEAVKATAENEIAGLSVAAEDANGEGEQPYIDFVLLGETKGDKLAKKLKEKYNWTGLVNGGKLAGLENAFDTAQEYITAGAAVAIVDSVNSAAVTVAPGVTLKATGDAVKKDDNGKDVPGGDVTLEANAHIDSLHHSLQGWANEQDADTASKVTVASSVLYSNIENDAKVELQGATVNQNGASLVSEKGSVNLNATGKQLYDAAEPAKNVVECAEKMWKTLKNFGYQFPELANLESDTVKVQKLLKDGKIKTETDRASFWDFCDSLKNFLRKEGKNVTKLSSEAKQMVQTLSDVVSPGSYTNYYVRSYMVDSQDSGDSNLDVAASVNIARLHNKGIVSLGEKANISAGKNIKVDTLADTDVVTATGYGGEFFAMSESNGNAAGATVAVQDFIGDSLILSGKNVTLTANTAGEDSGNISLNARNEMIQTGIILSAGKADKNLSVTGSLNLLTGGSNTLVLLDDETTVRAAGTFSMGTDSSATVTNVVGGLALGSARTNATVGAGVAVNLLDVNSIAMIGDTGSDASTTVTDTDTDEFKNKSVEEQNRIKAENALATARKVAAEQARIKKMGTDFGITTENLTSSLGTKTVDGAAKGVITAKNVSVTGNSSGTLNAVGIEGAEASESHAGFDFLTNLDKKGNYVRDQVTDAGKNVVGFPVDKIKKIASKNTTLIKTWDFSIYRPVQPANDNASEASFNFTAAASVAWNKVDSETASVISGVDVNLHKQEEADKPGSVVNTATDDVFSGAWAGAAAVNWFNGATGAAANNNAKKGALGTALAVNHLNRNADAVILSSSVSQAGNIKNTAIRNGSEAAAALGLAVTNDGQGTSTDASVAFGLAMNKANTGAHALLVDTTSKYEKQADNMTYTGGTDLVNSAYDGDIQVSGGVDLAWVRTDQAGTGIAAGMTAAVSEINNDIQSGIQGGSYTGLSNLLVAGEDALTQVNAAVGLGFSRSDTGIAAAGSLAYTELNNTNHSYISGTETVQATGDVTVTSQDISAKKENQYKEYLKARKVDSTGLGYLSSDTANKLGTGTAAGSAIVNVAAEVSEGKTNAAGAAISVNQVTNKFSSDIVNNKALEAGAVKAASDVHTNIVSVAAGVSVSEADWGGVGSLSFNDLDQDNIVSVTGNRNGTAADSGISAEAVNGAAKNTSHIVNVTGDFAGGKNAVGLGVAYNRMDDTTGVYAANNQIRAKDADKGVAVGLDADNDAYALALSLGMAATYKDNGTVAAHGNFGVNRGHNDTVAVIGEDKDGKKGSTRDSITNATAVTVKATDKTTKTTVAGAAELAIKDTTVALGVGVALTESDKGSEAGDGKESVRAEINNTDITTVKKDGKAPVISATATDISKATTVAVGAGLVKSARFAAQGIGADANIFKNNTAGLKDTTIDANGGSKVALVTVKADTSSTLKTGAAALQLAGPDTFLTGVVAVGTNRIKDTTTAAVTYTDKQTSVSQNVGNLDISAVAKGDILSVAMGVSGVAKGTVAAGGSGSYNFIENNDKAVIQNANVNSTGNVGVVAQSDEAISNYAGVLDVAVAGEGLSAAAGVTGSNNKISGKTEALIKDSTVAAAGSDTNRIKTQSKLKQNTDSEKYMIDGAVSRNTWSTGSFTEGGGDNKLYGVSRLQKGRASEEKTGIVVDASATHSIASVMANGGVAAGSDATASVAGVVNLNYVTGSTTAKVLDSGLNNANTRSDVTVNAADYTNVAEFSGAASVGIGREAGIAAGFTGTANEINRVTAAGVSTSSSTWNPETKRYETSETDKTKNNVYAADFKVTADAKQAISAFNVTGAVAGSTAVAFETGDNVNTSRLQSSTIATVTNTTLDYMNDAVVKASHEDAVYNLNVEAGITVTPDLFSAAGSLNVGVGVVNEESAVTADVEYSDIKAHEKAANDNTKSGLSIDAANSTRLEATLVSVGVAAGVFSGGVASSIAVNNIDTKVTSRIVGSELTADTIAINTTNQTNIKDTTGTGGGALIAGIGVGVDVTTLNDTVSAVVDRSVLKATGKASEETPDTLSINTETRRNIESTVAGVGVGLGGLAVNVLAVAVNEGVDSLGVAQDTDGKNTSFSHTDTINQVLNKVNNDINKDLSDNFYGITKAEKDEMKEKVKANAKKGTPSDGVGINTVIERGSRLEAANGALTVKNTELNDADLNGGSGSLGAAAVNVSDTVYHLNQLNTVYVDNAEVKGTSVSLQTHQGNVTADKDEAIRVRTVQAGLGGLAIGVGYAGLTTKGQTGVTIDKGTLTATNGDLTVKSTDNARSKSNMIGVSTGVLSVPVSVAHNTNIANNFVTVKGGSKLSATTDKTREVTDSEGHKVTEKAPAYINLQTERTGRVAAKTVGVGVGGASVVVNTGKAYDKSTSAVTVAEGTGITGNTFTADAIRLEAVNAPVIKAEAGGTGVSALGVSVMQSNAEAYSVANVTVGDNNSLLGDAVLAQAVIGKEGTDMTHAETHGTNVSLGLGVAPNKAKAITETTASVTMGKETYKTEKKEKVKNEEGEEEEKTVQGSYTNLALITQNNASRKAYMGNTTIGLAASIGTGDARADGNDKSLVTAKGGADSNGAVKLQNLKISASGNNTAKGMADGDSGGITAFGAAATITMNSKTTNKASLSGAWDVAENADIASLQQVTSRGTSKTGAGGILSVTWANSDNNVEMDTKTEIMEGAQLKAGQSYVLAGNKVVTGAYDNEHWNNHMNIGGVIQFAPNVKSSQDIKTTANVVVGENAGVNTEKGQVYDAYADMDVTNKVEGKSGGVGENMWVYSDSFITSTNKVTVNPNAVLDQKGEFETGNDITLSSSDKIKMDVAAEAYTGGLEGVLTAGVDNRVTRNNSVEVNGKLTSTHDINLYAGVNPDGSNSELNIKGLAEAHNNTLLSFWTNPDLKLDLHNNQQVKVGETGSGIAVRNINASAVNGNETFKKDVVKVANLLAKKSTETKTVTNMPGTSQISESNDNYVYVAGNTGNNKYGLLKTGIQNNVKIDITGALLPAAVTKNSQGQDVTVEVEAPGKDPFNVQVTNASGKNTETIISADDIRTGTMDYASQLGTQLAALNQLIEDYNTGKDKQTSLAAYLGYLQQRDRVIAEMESRHLFEEGDVTNANGETVKGKVYKTSGYSISYVEIPEITVSGGSIIVQSDTLYGQGKLEANGKPKVEINNRSNAYLILDGIRVGEDGGDIRFRGTSVASNDEINELNKKNSGKTASFNNLQNDKANNVVSAITVLNDNIAVGTTINTREKESPNTTGTYTAIPDVAVIGDIINNYGDVSITNMQGNITIGSGTAGKSVNINGSKVQLVATQGSISQDYVDGVVNIGGRPQDMNSKKVNEVIAAYRNKLKDRTDKNYDEVKLNNMNAAKSDISDEEAGRIAGDSIYIAAADINVNGLIQSGFSKYVADITAEDLSEENIQKLKNNGSEVTVQGRTMYKLNEGNRAVYDKDLGAYKYIVQVYYDPQTKGLVVEDIDTKGGKIYLSGRISSTGMEATTDYDGRGRIIAADGGAEIAITNASTANLSTGKILNNNIEGKITITDLAKNTWTEYTRSATKTMTLDNYLNYLKMTEEEKAAANFGNLPAVGYNTDDNVKAKTVQYDVKPGLRYNWTQGHETSTVSYYHKETNTLFWGGLDTSTNTAKLGTEETAMNPTDTKVLSDQPLKDGTFIDSISDKYKEGSTTLVSTDFGAILESQETSSSRTVTGEWKETGNWWALWSNPTYHTTWTTKTGSTQSYTFSIKADNPINIGFTGKRDGSISVKNTNTAAGNINLDGNVQNNSKDATLTVQALGGSIIQKSGTSLTTGQADLKAKNNIENIHITSMGERIDTGTQDADGNKIYTARDGVKLSALSYNGGNIDIDVVGGAADGQKLPGNVILTRLASEGRNASQGQGETVTPGSVSLKAEGNITQTVTDVTVEGREIRLTSVNGGIGTFDKEGKPGQAVVMDSFAEATGLSEDSASVNAEAKKHIYLAEKEGDMRVGSVISHDGDVRLESAGGRLVDALPQKDDGNNIDEDDLIHHWIDAGLIAGTEDYEGAYIRGLKQDAANFERTAREQYALCQSGEAGDQVREVFMTRMETTAADGTVTTTWNFKYASADDYLKTLLNDTSEEGNYYKNTVDAYTKPTYAWTKEQLLYAIRNAIVNKESGVNAESQKKEANIQGKNVTLVARGIGVNTNQTTEIKAGDLGGGSEASIAKMKQLANADAADVTMQDKDGNALVVRTVDGKQHIQKAVTTDSGITYVDAEVDKFVIGNLSPLGVYATGQVDVTGISDNVFIAGRSATGFNENEQAGFSAVNVGKITSVGNDVRLYTQEGIYNTAGQLGEKEGNIHAKDLIAYGGTKDIGTKEKPLTVSLSGDLLSANADGNVYIKNVNAEDKLRIGSVFAKDTVSLDSAAGFDMSTNPDYALGYLNAGKVLELKTDETKGEIGTAANPIRILNNAGTPEQYSGTAANNGMLINLKGKDGYVKGVNGTRGENTTMRLGLIEMAGDLTAASESYLEAGAVRLAEGEEGTEGYVPGINGEVDAGGNVKLEAVKDVVVNGPVKSGNPTITNPDAVAEGAVPVYDGGGAIRLTSANGSIQQNENGALVSRSLAVTSGKAVNLTNAGNTFREFTATGTETGETDEQGNKVKVINGGVNVSAHAGNTLTAGIDETVVYGNVTFTNLDAGGLTVNTDIVVKKNQDSTTGNIVFNQQGDILVEGALQAENSVSETSAKGNVTNNKAITADNHVRIEATAAGADEKGNIVLNDIVVANTIEGTAGRNITANEMDSVADIDLTAGNDVDLKGEVKTASGTFSGNAGNDIIIEDTVTAPEHISLTATNQILETSGGGLITNEVNVAAGNNVELTGGSNEFPRIIVNGITPEGSSDPNPIYQNVRIKDSTDNLSLNVNAKVNGLVLAENTTGSLSVDSGLKAGAVELRAQTDAGQQAAIEIVPGTVVNGNVTVAAGNNIILENTDNKFSRITLQGLETVTTEHGGKIYTSDAINGDVKVKTHGGPSLLVTTIAETSPEQLLMVGNDFALENLDADGGISMLNSIWAFGGEEGTGNITLRAGGDIVNGDDDHEVSLLAAGDIHLTSANGMVDNNGSISANNDVEVEAARGISAGENKYDIISAGNKIMLHTVAGDIEVAGNVETENGDIIILNGNLDDTGNVIEGTGNIKLNGNVASGNSIIVKAADGNIETAKGSITAKQDIMVQTGDKGNIVLNGDVDAENDIIATSRQGSIGLLGDIDAGRDVTAKTGKQGLIEFNTDWSDGKHDVHAGRDVNLTVEDSIIYVDGKVVTDTGDVHATAKTGGIRFNGNIQSGKDIAASVTEEGIIIYNGTVQARNDVMATTAKGNIEYAKTVQAGHNVTAQADAEGNITVGDAIITGTGDVALSTANGTITVGEEDGTGRIDAYGVVQINAAKADASDTNLVDILTSVESRNADVNVKTVNGNIYIGSNDPTTDTVTAKGNINLEAVDGKIIIEGKTSTKEGDITLQATNDSYVAGDAGKNIIIDHNGAIESAGNANLIAVNGDLHVTDDVKAQGTLNVETRGQGDISLDENVTVVKDMVMQTETGDITVGKNITAENGTVTVNAESGSVAVGTVDAGGNKSGKIEAGGNVTINAAQPSAGDRNLVDVVTSVESKNADVSIRTTNGHIHIGSNDPDTDTVTAKGDVNLEAVDGKIIIDGKTSTQDGDVTLHATNTTYTPGADGKNIIVNQDGKVESGRDVNLIAENGDLHVTDNVSAKGVLNAETRQQGDLYLDKDVTVVRDMTMQTVNGDITVGKKVNAEDGSVTIKTVNGDITIGDDVKAGDNVNMATGTGDITVGDDVKAGNNVNMTTGTGDVTVGSNGQGSVTADKDVTVNVGTGDVDIVKSVTSENGSVSVKTGEGDIHIGNNGPDTDTVTAKENVTLETADGKITVDGKTSTQDGDITLQASSTEYVEGEGGKNIIINQDGKIESGHDVNLIAENGDLHVTDNVTAQGTLNAETRGQGDISLDQDVTVVHDMMMQTETGDITVGRKVDAENGSVTMTTGTGDITVGADINAGQDVSAQTGTGDITVGEDITAGNTVTLTTGTGDVTAGSNGKGSVTADKDVTVNVGKGDVDIVKSVASENGSVSARTGEGDIHIGNNGPDTDTVTAKKDVKLETDNGRIEIYGKTSTETGDITLKAANDKYVAGQDGQNIIISDNGKAESGRDVNLTARNGDLHVTDDIIAKRDIKAETQTRGDVYLDDDMTVDGSVTMQTDTGDIVADQNVKAGNRIVAATGNGDITVGTADAKYVSLTSGGEDGHLRANAVYAQAGGNSNGTGPEDVKLGGSYVNVDTVVNKGKGSAPLTISTLGGAADKPVKDINIGVRVVDGVYTGGIQSASGAVMQNLWTEKGLLYMKDDTNLHISKVVVKEKLHVANDQISAAVFGIPPYHDGARTVFWNDAAAKNPASRLARWYDRSYADPTWMYLDLFYTGEVGSRYGVLMDAHWYRNLYGDSVSMADTMRIRTAPASVSHDIKFYDRNNLIDYSGYITDNSSASDADGEKITAE